MLSNFSGELSFIMGYIPSILSINSPSTISEFLRNFKHIESYDLSGHISVKILVQLESLISTEFNGITEQIDTEVDKLEHEIGKYCNVIDELIGKEAALKLASECSRKELDSLNHLLIKQQSKLKNMAIVEQNVIGTKAKISKLKQLHAKCQYIESSSLDGKKRLELIEKLTSSIQVESLQMLKLSSEHSNMQRKIEKVKSIKGINVKLSETKCSIINICQHDIKPLLEQIDTSTYSLIKNSKEQVIDNLMLDMNNINTIGKKTLSLLERVYEHEARRRKRIRDETGEQLRQSEINLSSFQITKKQLSVNVEEKERQLNITKAACLTLLKTEQELFDFDSLLQQYELKENKSKEDLCSMESLSKHQQKLVELAKETRSCYICTRKFTDQEFDVYIQHQSKSTFGDYKTLYSKWETDYTKLSEMKLIADKAKLFHSLTAEIREIKDKKSKLELKIAETEQLVVSNQDSMKHSHTDTEAIDSLKQHITSIGLLLEQADNYISELKLSQISDVDIDELSLELTSVDTKINELKQSISTNQCTLSQLQAEQVQAKKSIFESINEYKDEYNITNDFSVHNYLLEEEKQLQLLVLELNELQALSEKDTHNKIENVQCELSTLNTKLGEIKKERENMTAHLETLKTDKSSFENEKLKHHWKLQQRLDMFYQLIYSIKNTIEDGHIFHNDSALNKLSLLQAKLNDGNSEVVQLRKKMSELNSLKAGAYRERDNTQKWCNIQHQRRILKELRAELGHLVDTFITDANKGIEANLTELSSLSDVNGLGLLLKQWEALKSSVVGKAGTDLLVGYRSMVKEIQRTLSLEKEKLIETHASRIGRASAIGQDIENRRNILAQDKFSDIEKRYASTMIKAQTTDLVISDIEKYYKALEKAVSSYHQEKIMQINSIARELWRSTYRGTDIDYIEIRSEDEAQGTIARRSYKYRVVMQKGDTELDMRARCSAGQKVLASIIIRLALSEAFCCECGILAMDEPTTNLDEENTKALAESLKELISLRRHLKHFQLICITHDEAFVRSLGSNYTDSVFVVCKDKEGRFSKISQTKFGELFI